MPALAWGWRLTLLAMLVYGWSSFFGFGLPPWFFCACLGAGQWLLFACAPSLLLRLLVVAGWLAAWCSPPLSALLAVAYLMGTARHFDLDSAVSRLSASMAWLGLALPVGAAGGCWLIIGFRPALFVWLLATLLGALGTRDLLGAILDGAADLERRALEREWLGYSRY